ncbi:MAG TPA: class I SAM-dependent methyltransferase [Polyangia bacterium]|nr:class I SAM-dependent methyltransferase [Polyangia bacterium]
MASIRLQGTPFDDPILYDWEYRRRRHDVAFYRMLADERGGPILDAGCGTGRLLVPLARDGHRVLGIDRSAAMLARAAWRLSRAGRAARERATLARADLGALPARAGRFALVVAAFHTVQHCESDAALLAFLRGARQALIPGGWLAFDTFAPSPRFLERRGPSGTTRFRHPRTGRSTTYREIHTVEPGPDGPDRPVLAMRFRYADSSGRGRARTLSLRHRLFSPTEIGQALPLAGLTLIATWGGFDGSPLDASAPSEQHVYLARAGSPQPPRRRRNALQNA